MNWTDVEICLPFTDEEVLCRVAANRELKYVVCRYLEGTWVWYHYYCDDWLPLPYEWRITFWTHIHD